MITLIAAIQMISQFRRATEQQFRQHTADLSRSLRWVLLHKVAAILSENVGDSQCFAFGTFRPGYGFGESGFCGFEFGGPEFGGPEFGGISQPGSCRTGNQSMGLGADPRCRVLTCRQIMVVEKLA